MKTKTWTYIFCVDSSERQNVLGMLNKAGFESFLLQEGLLIGVCSDGTFFTDSSFKNLINCEIADVKFVISGKNFTQEIAYSLEGAKKPVRKVTMAEVCAKFGETVEIKG